MEQKEPILSILIGTAILIAIYVIGSYGMAYFVDKIKSYFTPAKPIRIFSRGTAIELGNDEEHEKHLIKIKNDCRFGDCKINSYFVRFDQFKLYICLMDSFYAKSSILFEYRHSKSENEILSCTLIS